MKTFAGTFFAILAAAAVIFALIGAKSRLNKWTDAKMRCAAEISSVYATAKDISEQPIFPPSEQTKNLRRMSDAIVQLERVERDLVSLLENKPFGLPLIKSERKLLENTKADIDELKRLSHRI
jgi:hypothetical protein